MNKKPYKLKMKDAAAAGETLARAFQEYPLMAWFTPDAEERLRQVRLFHTKMVRYAIRYGEVIATSPALEAVLVWVPSEKAKQTWWREMRCGNYRLLFTNGKRPGPRQAAYGAYSTAVHRRHATMPHIYLRLLGVDPAHRGKGYSSLLLRAAFERADREGRPCWLETQAERNVSIYRHLGFEVMEEGTIPGSDIRSWGMLRKTKP